MGMLCYAMLCDAASASVVGARADFPPFFTFVGIGPVRVRMDGVRGETKCVWRCGGPGNISAS